MKNIIFVVIRKTDTEIITKEIKVNNYVLQMY